MSRKTKTKTPKPLTGKQLADMDFKFETRKAALIKARGIEPGVTATVTLAQKQAALDLIEPDVMQAMDMARDVGKFQGKLDGFLKGKQAPRTEGEQRANDARGPISRILQEVFVEARKAVSKHGPMHSGHEGYAVILEELDELWDEIKADRGKQASARAEAIQVAAMAVRYVLDLDPR